jgi:Fic-DOC domain mobile mystery protein B
MSNDDLPIGATPLTPDDAKGLIPKGLSTRAHLDQFESRNIQQGFMWAMRGKKTPADILSIDFCLKLHKQMFNKTWQWAGQFRRYEVNIGNTPPVMISMSVKNLLDDVLAWIEFETYPLEEICIRFHHRLVYIHPFPNGNGRHARMMTDLLLRSLGQPLFTWGAGTNLTPGSKNRMDYIAALRMADAGDCTGLLEFARV